MAGAELEVRLLDKSDDRARLEVGQEHLDRYFREQSGQDWKRGLSVTYVALLGGELQGFVTYAPSLLDLGSAGVARMGKLPPRPVPVLHLLRMGVGKASQRRGVGEALTRRVYVVAHELKELAGCAGVLVDAKAEAVGYYARHGFLAVHEDEADADHAKAMFLPLNRIPKPTTP
jgi:hypothetical protein